MQGGLLREQNRHHPLPLPEAYGRAHHLLQVSAAAAEGARSRGAHAWPRIGARCPRGRRRAALRGECGGGRDTRGMVAGAGAAAVASVCPRLLANPPGHFHRPALWGTDNSVTSLSRAASPSARPAVAPAEGCSNLRQLSPQRRRWRGCVWFWLPYPGCQSLVTVRGASSDLDV